VLKKRRQQLDITEGGPIKRNWKGGLSSKQITINQMDKKKNPSSISSSETFVKGRAIFLSFHKTVNIQGYSKLREPIKMHENCNPLIW